MIEEKSIELPHAELTSRQVWTEPCLTLLVVGQTANNNGLGPDGGCGCGFCFS